MAAGAGLALLAALLAVTGAEQERKVSMEYNPGWNGSSVNVLHVRAVGSRDSLHYIWSSLGAPAALLVATSSPSSVLRLDWPRLLSPSPAGAVWIEPRDSMVDAAAVVFTRLFDLGDTDHSPFPPYDLSEFRWSSLGRSLNRTALMAELRGAPDTDPAGAFANGSLAFRITAFGSPGRSPVPPGLAHGADWSQLEFLLSGVEPGGNQSRFALEVTAVDAAGAGRRLRSLRSIDDEYSPGVFEWKSTAYGSARPRRSDGIRCRSGALQPRGRTLPRSAILVGFFGDSDVTVSALNVTFGGEEGQVYRDTKYLSWSALLGFGSPPEQSLSPLLTALAAALGTPLGALLVGGTAVALMAPRGHRSDYEPIN